MKRLIIFLIIALLPTAVLAHEAHGDSFFVNTQERAGVLPGEVFFFLDLASEWIEVNLLTPSTKQKQLKRLEFTDERIAEMYQLIELGINKKSVYERVLNEYKRELWQAGDMVEKILVLDGAEIVLAENLEQVTREQEQMLSELLELVQADSKGIFTEAVSTARIQNQKIFDYIVKNYQFTEDDIEKHRDIVREHLEYLDSQLEREDLIFSDDQTKRIEDNLIEVEKFLFAGLNVEAYQYMNRVKDVLYSKISN